MTTENETIYEPSLVDILSVDTDSVPSAGIDAPVGPTHGWTVEWAANYPPYDTSKRCVKCHCAFVGTTYERQIIPDEERKVVVLTERAKRDCERCGYVWFELVKEAG